MGTSEEKKGATSESRGSRKRVLDSVALPRLSEVDGGSSGLGAGKRTRSGRSLLGVMEDRANKCLDLIAELGNLYCFQEMGSEKFDERVEVMAEHLLCVGKSASMALKDPNMRRDNIDNIKRAVPNAIKWLTQLSISYYSKKESSIYDGLTKLVYEICMSCKLAALPGI